VASASFSSVVQMFHHRVRSTPEADALSFRKDAGWQTLRWGHVGARVRAIACGLHARGLAPEARSAILSGTRYEWILADLGILCAGGAATTIYPSNTADECAYILNDSGSVYVFVDTQEQVAKLRAVRDQIPGVKALVLFEGLASEDGWVVTLAQLEQEGRAWDDANAGRYDAVADAIGPDRLATLIYTSGTTGRPKGVELTHDCWVYEGEAIDSAGILSPNDKQFLWLPLAHSFGKVLEVAFIRIGIHTAVDGDVNRIAENCGEVQPTFMGAPPRIFEKAYIKAVGNAREGGPVKWAIFNWAIGVGREVSKLRQARKQPSGLLSVKFRLADRLVFSKLKARFGGRVRFFISGAAALNRDIAEFFHAADILILEGYGLTETSAASFVNLPENFVFGTVGRPLPGTEVRIAPEPGYPEGEGEILVKGRGVMRGYYNLADETAATLEDGWLRTGDIGRLDHGLLRITDRKKDLIKTSGGKYVAPQDLEGRLKARCTLISQVLVHGEGRNYCTALVTVAPDTAESWARQNGIAWSGYDAFVRHPVVTAAVADAVASLNAELPPYATLKKHAVLPVDFTVEGGELTPSMKMKRKVVEARYKNVLDGFYQDPAGSAAG
jgi:long-chain acyl-CoA synthetase